MLNDDDSDSPKERGRSRRSRSKSRDAKQRSRSKSKDGQASRSKSRDHRLRDSRKKDSFSKTTKVKKTSSFSSSQKKSPTIKETKSSSSTRSKSVESMAQRGRSKSPSGFRVRERSRSKENKTDEYRSRCSKSLDMKKQLLEEKRKELKARSERLRERKMALDAKMKPESQQNKDRCMPLPCMMPLLQSPCSATPKPMSSISVLSTESAISAITLQSPVHNFIVNRGRQSQVISNASSPKKPFSNLSLLSSKKPMSALSHGSTCWSQISQSPRVLPDDRWVLDDHPTPTVPSFGLSRTLDESPTKPARRNGSGHSDDLTPVNQLDDDCNAKAPTPPKKKLSKEPKVECELLGPQKEMTLNGESDSVVRKARSKSPGWLRSKSPGKFRNSKRSSREERKDMHALSDGIFAIK